MLLRSHPTGAAGRGWRDRRCFIDPATGAVAVNPCGGQVAGPAQIGGDADGGAMCVQYRVAIRVRCGGGNQVGNAGEAGRREGDAVDAGDRRDPIRGAAGGDHAPTGGGGRARDRQPAIAQAKD